MHPPAAGRGVELATWPMFSPPAHRTFVAMRRAGGMTRMAAILMATTGLTASVAAKARRSHGVWTHS